jgi:SPP1 gp7 family putative phage head morphogenesis protein
MNETELKGLVNDLVEKIVNMFKINISRRDSDDMVKQFYEMGFEDIEVQFGLNLSRDSKELAFLKDYTFDNITNFNDSMKDKLRKELSMGLLNNENQTQLTKRVKDVFTISDDRAKTIIRTETNRIFNVSRQTAAEKSGLKLMKQWVASIDDRTSPICRALDGKTIPLDKKFTYKGQSWDSPPSHPNCRSRLIYVPK